METNLNRWQAFGIHLGGSFVVLAILLVLLIFVWYPSVMLNLGGWQGIKIVAGVDIVLGPILTLIVFNPKKKSLKYDLLAILIFQLSCLSVGVYFVHSQSPAILVMSDEGLHVISHSEIENLDSNLSDLPTTKKVRGKPVFLLDLPDNKTESNIFKGTTEVFSGKPFYYKTALYKSFELNGEAYKTLITNFETDSEKECLPMVLMSYHGDLDICFDTQNRNIISSGN